MRGSRLALLVACGVATVGAAPARAESGVVVTTKPMTYQGRGAPAPSKGAFRPLSVTTQTMTYQGRGAPAAPAASSGPVTVTTRPMVYQGRGGKR